MTRETKIGLMLVLVLTCAFGFVVYKRIQKKNELLADAGHDTGAPTKTVGQPIPPTDDDRPFPKQPHNPPTKPDWGHQQEPPDPDDNHVVHNNDNNNGGGGSNPFGGSGASQSNDNSSSNGGTQWNLGGGNSNDHPNFQQPVTFEHEKGDVWDLEFDDFKEPPGQSNVGTGTQSGNPFGGNQTEPGKVHVGAFPPSNDSNQSVGNSQSDNTGQNNGGHPFANVKTDDHSSGGAFTPPVKSQPKPLFGPDFKGGQQAQTDPHGQSHVGNNQPTKVDFGQGTKVRKTSGTDDSSEYPFGKSADFKDPGKKLPPRDPDDNHYEPDRKRPFPGSGGFGSQRPRPGDGLRIYTVRTGDNYWSISRKAYGTARYYRALDAYNRYRISDPKRMRPGMKVLIPKRRVLVSRYPRFCPGNQGTGGQLALAKPAGFFHDSTGRPMYRVGKTDTLGGIAQKHLGRASRWIQIYRLNTGRIKNAKQLTIGTELRLPTDASRIAVAPRRRTIR